MEATTERVTGTARLDAMWHMIQEIEAHAKAIRASAKAGRNQEVWEEAKIILESMSEAKNAINQISRIVLP